MQFTPSFAVLYVLALFFGFMDGIHSSANVVATGISSRALPARQMRALAATAVFIGPFLFGTAVARTIGADLIAPGALSLAVAIAALLSAISWKLVTWAMGIPSSASHSLLGGLIGPVVVAGGFEALKPEGLIKTVVALLVSPLLALILGYLIMLLTLFLTRGATPRINVFFRRAQIATAFALGLSHGSNNAQKVMGVLAFGMVATGLSEQFSVPLWITASSAGAMALGTFFGGRRIIRTLGTKFYKIRPVHGFSAQTTAGAIIVLASLLGGPVSTTEVVSSTIVGVGSGERINKVRWQVFRDIGMAWLVTIPVTALLGALFYLPLKSLAGS